MKHDEKTQKNNVNGNGNLIQRIKKNPTLLLILTLFLIGVLVGVYFYWQSLQSRIYVEKAEVYAPTITISPQAPGVLEKLYVSEGEHISKSKVLAIVGGKELHASTSGIVVGVQNTPGQIVTSQTPVVQMINPAELRVIGHVQEDKGLKDIKPSQTVIFTMDAFGSKKYQGRVDEISPTARSSDIVFSISDKRQEQEFDVTVKFDVNQYPELKNGMSAKMWIYKH